MSVSEPKRQTPHGRRGHATTTTHQLVLEPVDAVVEQVGPLRSGPLPGRVHQPAFATVHRRDPGIAVSVER